MALTLFDAFLVKLTQFEKLQQRAKLLFRREILN